MNSTRSHYSARLIRKKFGDYINSKRKTKTAIGDLADNCGNTLIASDNIQKAELLGSHFSGVFTQENNATYNAGNLNTSRATFTQLISQFNVDIILDKLSQSNISKSPCQMASNLGYYTN